NESQTLIVTIDGSPDERREGYLQANEGVAPTTVDPDALPAGVYYIDAVAGVINNFNEFVNEGPVTVVINEEGDTVTYETVEEYLTSIVEANESQTLIVTIDGNQYYISEEYLQANEGVAPTTVDPDALPAGVYYIDAVAGVINNFNEFVNEGPVTVVINEEGDTVTYETVEEYLTSIVEARRSSELIVTIDGDQYYISEEYLQANEGVAPTTVDPEALPDGVYYIDAVAGVI